MKDKCKQTVSIEIKKYERYASIFNKILIILQLIIVLLATILPFILNNTNASKTISIIVAVAAALTTSLKLGDWALRYKQFAQKLNSEFEIFSAQRQYYDKLSGGEALDLFIDKTNEIRDQQGKLRWTHSSRQEEGQF